MSHWIAGDTVPDGEGRCFDVEGRHMAVINRDGAWYALTGSCPRAERGRAEVPLQEVIDACPNREWHFDMVEGACTFKPQVVEELHSVSTQGRFWETCPDCEVELS